MRWQIAILAARIRRLRRNRGHRHNVSHGHWRKKNRNLSQYRHRHQNKCIGSNTLFNTSRGIIPLNRVMVGDKILAWNKETNKVKMETVYYIRNHGYSLVNHYKVILKTGNKIDIVNLTEEHLVVLSDKTLQRTDKLKINDKLLNINNKKSIIINIEKVLDIPLTPVVLSGNIVLPNNTVIFHEAYEHFISKDKDINKIDNILKTINIPLIENY